MAQKITKREVLAIIKEKLADMPEVVAYVDNEVTLLDKKNEYRKTHKSDKPTKAQAEALALRPAVLEALGEEGLQSKPIADKVGVAFQKVTPILRALVTEGLADAYEEKGKTFYRLPKAEE